jgi:hypothetical protein
MGNNLVSQLQLSESDSKISQVKSILPITHFQTLSDVPLLYFERDKYVSQVLVPVKLWINLEIIEFGRNYGIFLLFELDARDWGLLFRFDRGQKGNRVYTATAFTASQFDLGFV